MFVIWEQIEALLPPYVRGKRRTPHKKGIRGIGTSRGGKNTKIHLIADARGRPKVICLTGGHRHSQQKKFASPRLLLTSSNNQMSLGPNNIHYSSKNFIHDERRISCHSSEKAVVTLFNDGLKIDEYTAEE